jgi:hypothetical protein
MSIQFQIFLRLARVTSLFSRTAMLAVTFLDFHQLLLSSQVSYSSRLDITILQNQTNKRELEVSKTIVQEFQQFYRCRHPFFN